MVKIGNVIKEALKKELERLEGIKREMQEEQELKKKIKGEQEIIKDLKPKGFFKKLFTKNEY